MPVFNEVRVLKLDLEDRVGMKLTPSDFVLILRHAVGSGGIT